MGIIGWIVLGGLAGWLASKIMGTDPQQGIFMNIIVGIVGALIGGFIMRSLGQTDVTGFNLWSFVVALLGSVVLLAIYRAVVARR
jgi:uncharacterized membrane protein YeaQ/YmgE (transglycosylase-associated protein family)